MCTWLLIKELNIVSVQTSSLPPHDHMEKRGWELTIPFMYNSKGVDRANKKVQNL